MLSCNSMDIADDLDELMHVDHTLSKENKTDLKVYWDLMTKWTLSAKALMTAKDSIWLNMVAIWQVFRHMQNAVFLCVDAVHLLPLHTSPTS